jgi:hypothetical protein
MNTKFRGEAIQDDLILEYISKPFHKNTSTLLLLRMQYYISILNPIRFSIS